MQNLLVNTYLLNVGRLALELFARFKLINILAYAMLMKF